MRSFRLPPKPVAILCLLALLAVPWLSLVLVSQEAVGMVLRGSVGGGSRRVVESLAGLSFRSRLAGLAPEQRLLLGFGPDGRLLRQEKWLEALATANPSSLPVQTRWAIVRIGDASLRLSLEERSSLIDAMEKRDPGNALWPLQRARLLASVSATCESPKQTYHEFVMAGRKDLPPELKVVDRQRFDQGMAELLRGIAQPRYEPRGHELMQQRAEAFGTVKSLQDETWLLLMAFDDRRPEWGQLSSLATFAEKHGEELLRQGKTEEARPFLRAWLPLAEMQLRSNDDSLLPFLLAAKVLRLSLEEEAAWRAAGNAAEADRVAALSARLLKPCDDYRRAIHRKDTVDELELLGYQHAGVMPSMLLPALGSFPLPPRAEWYAWRQAEAGAWERSTLWLAGHLLWLWLAGALLLFGFRAPATPPAPEGDLAVRFRLGVLPALAGIALPLFLYLVVTRGVFYSDSYWPRADWHYTMMVSLLAVSMLAALVLSARLCKLRWKGTGLRLIVLPSLLILVTVALALVSLRWETPRMIREASFMRPTDGGILQVECSLAERLRKETLQALEAAQKLPAPH